jgi:hypothetical protein
MVAMWVLASSTTRSEPFLTRNSSNTRALNGQHVYKNVGTLYICRHSSAVLSVNRLYNICMISLNC